MDQDSSNGTVNDKRNWRERLGIGAKEMPKLSDEFKTERAAPSLSKPAPQPVTRTAPMAPRQAPRMAVPAEKRTEPTLSAAPQQQSALADKLRAQREAAEKLAAQRVNAARERAEAKSAAPEPRLGTGSGRAAAPAGERPKFSFADDTPPPAFQSRGTGAGAQPLAPPRPALGGDRGPVPPRSYGGQNGSYRQDPPPYRPIDPASGYSSYGTSKPGYVPPRPYVPPQPAGGPAPLPPRRASYDAPRVPVDDPYEDERYQPDPRLSRSMATRARQPQPQLEDTDDVFEDAPAPAPQRRRASAADYNAAYREVEETVEEPVKRSSGPWLLLLALLLAAVATGGIVWFYQTKMKPVTNASTTTSGEQVPVVEAPAEPAKTAAEAPADGAAPDQAATNKKQIYDRIVGDQEVKGGTVVPTEQPPVQPEPAASTDGNTQPAAADGQAQPAAGTGEDAVPLPLPPPPGDNGANTQGSLDNNQIQPAANQVAGNSNSELPLPPAAQPPQPADTGSQPPVTDTTQQQASADAGSAAIPQMEAITDQPAAASAKAEPAKPAASPKPAEAKAKAKPAKSTKTAADKSLGSKPVVLVPPSQDSGTTTLAVAPGQDVTQGAPSQSVTVEPAPLPSVQKKKTIFDLFKGKSASDAPEAAPVEPVQPTQQVQQTQQTQKTQQVASVPKAQTQAPAQTTSGGSGFVAQLASFRSQAEAQQEYSRLKAKYPAIVSGLSPNISTATVAGSTRYRLGLGPMGSREDASQVCGSLLASGERDCIVRKQ